MVVVVLVLLTALLARDLTEDGKHVEGRVGALDKPQPAAPEVAASRHEETEAACCGEHVVAVEDQILQVGRGAGTIDCQGQVEGQGRSIVKVRARLTKLFDCQAQGQVKANDTILKIVMQS